MIASVTCRAICIWVTQQLKQIRAVQETLPPLYSWTTIVMHERNLKAKSKSLNISHCLNTLLLLMQPIWLPRMNTLYPISVHYFEHSLSYLSALFFSCFLQLMNKSTILILHTMCLTKQYFKSKLINSNKERFPSTFLKILLYYIQNLQECWISGPIQQKVKLKKNEVKSLILFFLRRGILSDIPPSSFSTFLYFFKNITVLVNIHLFNNQWVGWSFNEVSLAKTSR